VPRDQAQPESQSGDAPFARGVVAVIRAPAAAIALTVARGLAGTDVAGIEVTMTSRMPPTSSPRSGRRA
jgi:2-keto-3-deoxy-6-phosphogluconate aldolase